MTSQSKNSDDVVHSCGLCGYAWQSPASGLHACPAQSKRHALRDPETGSWTTAEKLAAEGDYRKLWQQAVDDYNADVTRESKRADRIAKRLQIAAGALTVSAILNVAMAVQHL